MIPCVPCGREFKSQYGFDSHNARVHPPEVFGVVAAETDAAIEAASHLVATDRGAVEVLRYVARIIDGFEANPEAAGRDNVTIPTYLKFADALGLTPAGRLRLAKPKESGGSKLAQLRSIQGDRSS